MRKEPKLLVRKRHFLLLEVLIAFVLIALSLIPLIAPHTFILIEQKKFNSKIELDHLINLTFADIVERMYRNEIPWNRIVNGDIFEIEEIDLQRMGYDKKLPFTGSYRFEVEYVKPDEEAPKKLYLLSLHFTFVPLEKTKAAATEKKNTEELNYYYELFAIKEREMEKTPSSDGETPVDAPNEEGEGVPPT